MRTLPAGARLRIVVSARGYVTRATTFAIRDGRAPRGGSLG
jgi:hypothetical protein